MTHQQAVAQGLVAPLKILAYNVTEGYADLCRRYPQLEVVMDEDNVSRENAELVLGLAAMKERGLRKAFTFHSTNAKAKRFQRDAGRLLGGLWGGGEGGDQSDAAAGAPPEVLRVDSAMSATAQQAILDQFRGPQPSILANAKLLATGMDVPAVDLVVFADPKQSHVEILQVGPHDQRLR